MSNYIENTTEEQTRPTSWSRLGWTGKFHASCCRHATMAQWFQGDAKEGPRRLPAFVADTSGVGDTLFGLMGDMAFTVGGITFPAMSFNNGMDKSDKENSFVPDPLRRELWLT